MEPEISLESLGREPRVWLRVPGFVVRNYSPDLEASVLHHMTTYFITEEPFCSTSKIAEDPVSLHEVTEWWRVMLRQNLSVVALPEGGPGADLRPISESSIPLAGVNVLVLARKDDPPQKPVEEQFQGGAMRRAVGPYLKVSKMVNCFEEYGVDKYMDAAGLSVHPSRRGLGLGEALLRARFPLCAALGVRVTKTLFSSVPAQKVALRSGYQTVQTVLYGDLKTEQGELHFPEIPPTNRVLLTVRTDLC